MKSFIKNNSCLVERVLLEDKINFPLVKDLKKMYGLRKNIDKKNLHKKGCNWTFTFMFSNPVDSEKEFKKYLRENKIRNYKLIEKEKYLCEDYRIILKTGIRVDFYNP